MKKTFSRFQIAYIHVILLLLIALAGLVRLYHKPDAERIISWICAEKPDFSAMSHYKSDYSLHVSSNML